MALEEVGENGPAHLLPDRADPRQSPIEGHRLLLSPRRGTGEHVTPPSVLMAERLRQPIEGVQKLGALVPEAQEPFRDRAREGTLHPGIAPGIRVANPRVERGPLG